MAAAIRSAMHQPRNTSRDGRGPTNRPPTHALLSDYCMCLLRRTIPPTCQSIHHLCNASRCPHTPTLQLLMSRLQLLSASSLSLLALSVASLPSKIAARNSISTSWSERQGLAESVSMIAAYPTFGCCRYRHRLCCANLCNITGLSWIASGCAGTEAAKGCVSAEPQSVESPLSRAPNDARGGSCRQYPAHRAGETAPRNRRPRHIARSEPWRRLQ